MSSSTKYAILVTSFSIILKMTLFYLGLQFSTYNLIAIFGPLLFLLVGMAISNYQLNQTSAGNAVLQFNDYFKNALKVGVLFAVIYSFFIYLYYNNIDVNFFDNKMAENLKSIEGQGIPAEHIEKYKENASFFLSAYKQSFFTLLGFLFISMIYASVISIGIKNPFFSGKGKV